MMATGRPTKYTEELADEICKRISITPAGLETICKSDDMPDKATIFNWIHTHKSFFDKYMVAKQEQAHVLADRLIHVADEVLPYQDKDQVWRVDNGMVSLAKIRIDALKWATARLAPKYYSETRLEEQSNRSVEEEAKKRKAELDEKFKRDY